MKNIRFCIVLFLFSAKFSFAQWIPAEGINGGSCKNIIRVEDSTLFMLCDGMGLVKQQYADSNWTMVLDFPLNKLVNFGNTLIAQPNHLFTNELFRSIDQGNTWEVIQTIPLSNILIIENQLYAWNPVSHFIVNSSNQGSTWNNFLPTGNNSFCDLFSDATHLYYYYQDNPQFIYRYTILNSTFDSILQPISILNGNPIYSILDCDSTLIVASDSLYFYQYSNQSWSSTPNGNLIKSFVAKDHVLYGCGSGIFKFNGFLQEWACMDTCLPKQTVNSLLFSNSEVFCAGELGTYKSDASFRWHANNLALHGAEISSISSINEEVWVCSSLGVFKSKDGGINFYQEIIPEPGCFSKVILTDSAYYLVSEQNMLVSSNQGLTWKTIPFDFDPTLSIVTDVGLGSEYIFAVCWLSQSMVLYRTRYKPIVWELVPGSDVSLIYKIAVGDTTTLVSRFNSSITMFPLYISFNNGENLTPDQNITNLDRCRIKYEKGKFYIVSGQQIFISDDNAISWINAQLLENNVNIQNVNETPTSLIAIANISGIFPKIYLTHNLGYLWSDITDNLPARTGFLTNSDIVNNRMLVGTSKGGLWYRDDLFTEVSYSRSILNNNLNILPNPNNGAFELEIDADETSKGILRITEQTGKILSKEEIFLHPGHNRIPCTIKKADGIFFVDLLTGQQVRSSGKVVVIK